MFNFTSSSNILTSIFSSCVLFFLLSSNPVHAAENNISDFNDYELRDSTSNYTWDDWVVEESSAYNPIDGNPVVCHYKFWEKLRIGSQMFDVTYCIYSHNDQILEITLSSDIRLDQDDSTLAIEAGTEKYITAFYDLFNLLNEKYSNSLFYGLEDSGPQYSDDPVEGLYEYGIDVEWYNRNFAAYWEDSELDNIDLSMEMTYMRIGSQESLSMDLRLEYRAEKEWDKIISYDSVPSSSSNDIRDKL